MKCFTIQDVIDTIVTQVPGAPKDGSVDTIKIGDPTRPVTGIITSFTVTFEVIRKAVQSGANFIITHEPTFYHHYDRTDWLSGDSVYEAKLRLLKERNLTVWRFHDYWHMHMPDGILTGVAKELGWESYLDPVKEAMAVIPEVKLADLAQELKRKLKLPYVRVAGDLTSSCKRIGMLLGAPGAEKQLEFLQRMDVDTVICGESVEWSVCEYVRDAVSAGIGKSLIILGHANSEEAGIKYLSEWLRTLLPDASFEIAYVPTGDPILLI